MNNLMYIFTGLRKDIKLVLCMLFDILKEGQKMATSIDDLNTQITDLETTENSLSDVLNAFVSTSTKVNADVVTLLEQIAAGAPQADLTEQANRIKSVSQKQIDLATAVQAALDAANATDSSVPDKEPVTEPAPPADEPVADEPTE